MLRIGLGTTVAIGALGMLLGGCVSRTVVTTIPHPMQTGEIPANRISHQRVNDESHMALPPGTLDNSAEITRMDTEAVCFDTVLNWVDDGDGQTWTDLRNWEITLDLPNNARMVQPTVQLYEPSAQQYDGRVHQQVQTGVRDVCVGTDPKGACVAWEQRPVYQWQWVPGIVTVVTGGGGICFDNQGYVTPATSEITLNLHRTGRTVSFAWELSSIVAQ